MAFCINCGQELAEGAKFCADCGKAVNDSNSSNQRKTVYNGEIHKCPNCGQNISGFMAICPSCGHEFNSVKITETLNNFIKQVKNHEEIIINSQSTAKRGWNSWSSAKKTWWVILNIVCVCIPLAIYKILPFFLIGVSPKLSTEEKFLSSIIENFAFPNERETILEGLVYVKEKINFISSQTINQKTTYWFRLWFSKAEQLKQKSDILFADDFVVKQSYDKILLDKQKIEQEIKTKNIIGVIFTALLLAVIIVCYIVG